MTLAIWLEYKIALILEKGHERKTLPIIEVIEIVAFLKKKYVTNENFELRKIITKFLKLLYFRHFFGMSQNFLQSTPNTSPDIIISPEYPQERVINSTGILLFFLIDCFQRARSFK